MPLYFSDDIIKVHKTRVIRKEAMKKTLAAISKDEELKRELALFGGGLLYLLKGSGRSTSDLDFTPTQKISKEIGVKLAERIERLMPSLGFIDVRRKLNGNQNRIKAKIPLEGFENGIAISVEFSSRGYSVFQLRNYLVPTAEGLEILGEHLYEIACDKLTASIWRSENRRKGLGYKPSDVYDIYFIQAIIGNILDFDLEEIRSGESKDVGDILDAIILKGSIFGMDLRRKDVWERLASLEVDEEIVDKNIKKNIDLNTYMQLSLGNIVDYWHFLIEELKRIA
ncbi:MAG: hypothetical protein D6769_00185 [Methanobacteriota archaeon]|nr:MAG: hypothetical protein D6769_00185 [Euryarchaeota archaeon]